jgi:hypothetical protein
MGGRHIPVPVVLALALAALALMYCQKACAHQAGEPSDNELATERLRMAKFSTARRDTAHWPIG